MGYSQFRRSYKEPRPVELPPANVIYPSDLLRRMITVDIQRFSTHLAAIYSNIAKPVLDVILYNYQLSQNVGAEGILLLTFGVQASAALRESLPKSQRN